VELRSVPGLPVEAAHCSVVESGGGSRILFNIRDAILDG
jgi:hypothetical protein